MIVFCRVVLGAFFGGSMLTLLYSLAGALLCLAGMLLLKRVIPEQQLWLCSAFRGGVPQSGTDGGGLSDGRAGNAGVSSLFTGCRMYCRRFYRGLRPADPPEKRRKKRWI